MATGDYDLLQPWFDAYVKAIPLMTERTQLYYHHGGVYFPETFYFWMLPNVNNFGWNNKGNEIQNGWIRFHTQGGLEVIAQMLDCVDNTQDATFAHDKLLPMAEAVLTYYDQHWKRGDDGKIVFNPDQALETYQSGVTNPTPDIAGLKSDLPRLISLPETWTTPEERSTWSKLLNDLPPFRSARRRMGKSRPMAKAIPQEFPPFCPLKNIVELPTVKIQSSMLPSPIGFTAWGSPICSWRARLMRPGFFLKTPAGDRMEPNLPSSV